MRKYAQTDRLPSMKHSGFILLVREEYLSWLLDENGVLFVTGNGEMSSNCDGAEQDTETTTVIGEGEQQSEVKRRS